MIRMPRINKANEADPQQAQKIKQKFVFVRMTLVSMHPKVIRIVRIEKEVG